MARAEEGICGFCPWVREFRV